MQNALKTVFIFTITLFLISCASSEIRVSKLGDLPEEIDLKNLPTEKQYPDSDGVILFENVIFDVDYVPSVGIETYKTYHKIYRVFRNEEHFMENHIVLDDDTVFNSFSARTIKPDGTTIDLNENDIYYWKVSKSNKDHKSMYQRTVYNIPKLKKGDIIEVKFTVINQYFYMADKYFIQDTLPKEYARLEVSIPNFIFDPPARFYFKYIARNIEMDKPEFSKGFGDTGDQTYTWEKKNIPAFIAEPGMGKKSAEQGHMELRLSRWNSWKYFSRKMYEMFFQPLMDNMSEEETELLSQKNEVLLKNSQTDLDKIKTLYSYVQKYHYSDTHVYFGHAVRPNSIKTILERGYGDCKDHAFLLIALLQNAGFKAYPVLINADDQYTVDPEFVTNNFNHAIVKVHMKEGQVLWLDPTSKFTPFGKLPRIDEGMYSIEIKPKKALKDKKLYLEKAPSSSYSDHLTNVSVEGKIDAKQAVFRIRTEFSGNSASDMRDFFTGTSRDKQVAAIRKNLSPAFFDAEISDIEVMNITELEKPLVLKFKVSKELKDPERIPFIPVIVINRKKDPGNIYRKNRKYPLKLKDQFSRKYSFDISFDPASFKTLFNPQKLNGDIAFKDVFQWKTSAAGSPGRISFNINYFQKKKDIPAEEVHEYLKKVADAYRHIFKFYIAGLTTEVEEIKEKIQPEEGEKTEAEPTENDADSTLEGKKEETPEQKPLENKE